MSHEYWSDKFSRDILSHLVADNATKRPRNSILDKFLLTGQENVYMIHIKDVQHIFSVHKYDQAYHDK